MQYGKGYYREKLGVDVTTGWLLDTFGHHAQMPQLLALGGIQELLVRPRRAPGRIIPSEFFWEGIDGTRIAAFYLPHSYATHVSDRRTTRPGSATFAKQRFDSLDAQQPGAADRVGSAGADVSEPEEHLVAERRAFNRDAKAPFTMRMAVPADLRGGRRPLAPTGPCSRGSSTRSSRGSIAAGSSSRTGCGSMERKLLTAEKLSALAAWLGSPADPDVDLECVGAGAVQRDARPGLGRHDRPRL